MFISMQILISVHPLRNVNIFAYSQRLTGLASYWLHMVGHQGILKKKNFSFNIIFFIPEIKFRTALKYFQLLFYVIIIKF